MTDVQELDKITKTLRSEDCITADSNQTTNITCTDVGIHSAIKVEKGEKIFKNIWSQLSAENETNQDAEVEVARHNLVTGVDETDELTGTEDERDPLSTAVAREKKAVAEYSLKITSRDVSLPQSPRSSIAVKQVQEKEDDENASSGAEVGTFDCDNFVFSLNMGSL